MEDKKISEAIKLLYKGAKMLAYHCPDCGTPIFKYQDKMFCPSCGKEAVFESEVRKQLENEQVGKVKQENDVVKLSNKGLHPTSRVQEDEDYESLKLRDVRVNKSDDLPELHGENSYKKLREALKVKLEDISGMLINAKSPEEIERILNLLERTLSILKQIENR